MNKSMILKPKYTKGKKKISERELKKELQNKIEDLKIKIETEH
jgi:hypothetical protein